MTTLVVSKPRVFDWVMNCLHFISNNLDERADYPEFWFSLFFGGKYQDFLVCYARSQLDFEAIAIKHDFCPWGST